jgi:hypothetical protein
VRAIWRRLAVTALRAVRPYVKLNADQSLAWQVVIDLLESL